MILIQNIFNFTVKFRHLLSLLLFFCLSSHSKADWINEFLSDSRCNAVLSSPILMDIPELKYKDLIHIFRAYIDESYERIQRMENESGYIERNERILDRYTEFVDTDKGKQEVIALLGAGGEAQVSVIKYEGKYVAHKVFRNRYFYADPRNHKDIHGDLKVIKNLRNYRTLILELQIGIPGFIFTSPARLIKWGISEDIALKVYHWAQENFPWDIGSSGNLVYNLRTGDWTHIDPR